MPDYDRLLAAHPFFNEFQADYLHQIACLATTVCYERNAYIFHEGDAAEQFYLITRGHVMLETFGVERRGSISIETIEAGEVLGWSWLFAPYRWHFSARTLEEVEVIVLDGVSLRYMCEADPMFGYALLKHMAVIIMQRLQRTRLQLIDMYRADGG
ncbi:hypothetical protein KDW_48790 [Dictyobacter vulcani]|uniref:Cyclic nucleotide-binding domain-containing protein n=1 Tax=Dictyobacter vulcani TaxID=2607529 RepID=A0A5J4KW03_9CHLR|nr:Crp/Fnr family transcriptional regulator [Dictyobacter vulcani]GER90717.1 hypothetical protein KDW_48790 [Dictyobacter vulcani]